jgi:thiol:disulfide interchange protein
MSFRERSQTVNRCSGLIAVVALLGGSDVEAADVSIGVSARVRPESVVAGEPAILEVDIALPEGWHLWSLKPGAGPRPLRVTMKGPAAFEGGWYGRPPVSKFEPAFERALTRYDQDVRLERAIRVPSVAGENVSLQVVVEGQICSPDQCLNQRAVQTVPLRIHGASTEGRKETAPPQGVLLEEQDIQGTPAESDSKSLVSFLLLAFVFGLGALATPCVFPAIPLTVSFFSKFSDRKLGRAARLAATYAGTMVLAFSGAGVLVAIVFGATGIQRFAAHPLFNAALGVLLVAFGLNLIGFFDVGLPVWVTSWVNRAERRASQRVRSADGSRGIADYVWVATAALTSTCVFFTCTAGFVGVILVDAARGEWFWPMLGMLSFSSAFALPFFLFAIAPRLAGLVRGLGQGGVVQLRAILGFLELAAATKFFSNTDLVLGLHWLSRDLGLSLWIALALACGAYLLGWLRLDEGAPRRTLSSFSFVGAVACLAFAAYMLKRLDTGESLGGWLDAWLPPAPAQTLVVSGGAAASEDASRVWMTDLVSARAKARETGRRVFVNYTGYTCTNCRYMETTVFPRPSIARLLENMVRVELYTDGISPSEQKNRAEQLEKFSTAALPFYAIETADGEILATFAGSTNDADEFQQFLWKGLNSLPEVNKTSGTGVRLERLDASGEESLLSPTAWTLVSFWATWCAPCREELEGFLVEKGRQFQDAGGRFVTIALEASEDRQRARVYLEGLGVRDMPALWLPVEPERQQDLRNALGFDGRTVPYTALVSPEGQVVWSASERLDAAQLQKQLDHFVRDRP